MNDIPRPSDYRPILCLDFDGVLHSYDSGWKGADVIPDPPVPGWDAFLADAVNSFQVHIFSSRSNQPGGIEAMKNYLRSQGLPLEVLEQIQWPASKPPALVTIDDRAVCFEGKFPMISDLLNFQPWNKRHV